MLLISEPSLGEEEKAALAEVVDCGWITMGDRVRAFERAFAERHDVSDSVAVSSCTAGLHMLLQALDIGAGDEVLVPSLTFVATVNAVLYVGASPVFVDIESLEVPHVSCADAVAKCSARTRAVIVMHYAGYLVDRARWREFASAHGVLLIEDAAHAVGADGVGLSADAAVFSFFGNKNMTTGEGGMVVAQDSAVLDRVRHLRSHGMTSSIAQRLHERAPSYDVVMLGYNYRMDDLRAALGLVQIRHLRDWNERRRSLAGTYRELLADYALPVTIPFPGARPSSHHIFPVVLPEGSDRGEIMRRMREAGVQTSVHYPPVHRFSLYRQRFAPEDLANTEAFADRELTLPLHPKLGEPQLRTVVASLARALTQ
jgi:dTDP-4-amino-4,6-dideoxygalactose transaminase